MDQTVQRHTDQVSWIHCNDDQLLTSSRDGQVLSSVAGSSCMQHVCDTCPGSFAGGGEVSPAGQAYVICPKLSTPDELQLVSVLAGDAEALPVPGGPLMLDKGGDPDAPPRFKQLDAGTAMAISTHAWEGSASCCVVAFESGLLAAYSLQAASSGVTGGVHANRAESASTAAKSSSFWGSDIPLPSLLQQFPSLGEPAAPDGGDLAFDKEGVQPTLPARSSVSQHLRSGHAPVLGSLPPAGAASKPEAVSVHVDSMSVFSSSATCCDLTAEDGQSGSLLALCGGVSRELAVVRLRRRVAPGGGGGFRGLPAPHAGTELRLLQHTTLPAAGVAAVRWAGARVAAAACWDSSVRLFACGSEGGLVPTAVLAPACGRPTCAAVLHMPVSWHSAYALSPQLALCDGKGGADAAAAAAAPAHSSGRLRQKWAARTQARTHSPARSNQLDLIAAGGSATGIAQHGGSTPHLLVAFDSGRCCVFALPPETGAHGSSLRDARLGGSSVLV